MSARETTMLKIHEILRLHFGANLGIRKTARSLNLSVGVVQKYVARAKVNQLGWPLPTNMSETTLERLLKTKSPQPSRSSAKSRIDFPMIHEELKQKGVTLELLWEEYCQADENPLSYSRYCFHYKEWKKKQKRSMRQVHRAGEKVFIDYSGKTFNIIDPETGDIRQAEIFVGVLGASDYTYAQATWSQQLPDFIVAQVRMFEFFGGVPELVVPDNLKSAVTDPCYYDPDINPSYAKFIAHYDTAVLPARPYRPKDKAKAESGVQVVQRWILARLRHQTFVGLGELNAAIKALLVDLNEKPFQKKQGSRALAFEKLDKPALKSLPAQPYRYQQYKQVRAGVDYHVRLNQHYYSVPHQYCGDLVDVWFNQNTVECYVKGERIATHLHSTIADDYSTITQHMPKRHRKQQACSKESILQRAKAIGLHTEAMAKSIFQNKAHQEQGYRSCLGMLKLKDIYGEKRLELACKYALHHQLCTTNSLISVLKHHLDHQADQLGSSRHRIIHSNIRGAIYYH
jgi:transposase